MLDGKRRTLTAVVVGSVDKLTVTFACLKRNACARFDLVTADDHILENADRIVMYEEAVLTAIVLIHSAFDYAVYVYYLCVAVESSVDDVNGFFAFGNKIVLYNDILGSVDSRYKTCPITDVDAFDSVHSQSDRTVGRDAFCFFIRGIVFESKIAGRIDGERAAAQGRVTAGNGIAAAGKSH